MDKLHETIEKARQYLGTFNRSQGYDLPYIGKLLEGVITAYDATQDKPQPDREEEPAESEDSVFMPFQPGARKNIVMGVILDTKPYKTLVSQLEGEDKLHIMVIIDEKPGVVVQAGTIQRKGDQVSPKPVEEPLDDGHAEAEAEVQSAQDLNAFIDKYGKPRGDGITEVMLKRCTDGVRVCVGRLPAYPDENVIWVVQPKYVDDRLSYRYLVIERNPTMEQVAMLTTSLGAEI